MMIIVWMITGVIVFLFGLVVILAIDSKLDDKRKEKQKILKVLVEYWIHEELVREKLIKPKKRKKS